MPTCLMFNPVGYGASAGVPGAVYVTNQSGNAYPNPLVRAMPLLPDTSKSNITDCAAVSLSGVEYQALLQSISSGSSGTVQTPTSQNWQELGNMSIADAQVISGYVGLLWAGVWGIKQVIKSLSFYERNQDE